MIGAKVRVNLGKDSGLFGNDVLARGKFEILIEKTFKNGDFAKLREQFIALKHIFICIRRWRVYRHDSGKSWRGGWLVDMYGGGIRKWGRLSRGMEVLFVF